MTTVGTGFMPYGCSRTVRQKRLEEGAPALRRKSRRRREYHPPKAVYHHGFAVDIINAARHCILAPPYGKSRIFIFFAKKHASMFSRVAKPKNLWYNVVIERKRGGNL